MVNNLLSVWSTVGSVALAVLMLLVMITIHEFGHYIAGKILHFKIDEFSIGFGPAIVKHKNKKTGEQFSLRIIPLGGYCAFAGEDGLEDEEKKKEEPAEPFPEHAEQNAEQNDGKSDEAAAPVPDEGAKEKTEEKPVDKSGYFTNKKPWQRIIVLFAGAFMNYVLALLLIMTCFFAYGQTMVAVYKVEETEEYASEFCLHDRDIFYKVNGKDIYMQTDIAQALNGKQKGDRVEFELSRIVSRQTEINEAGEEVEVSIERERMTVTIMLRSDVAVKNSSDLNSVWQALGVRYERQYDDEGQETGGYYQLANSVAKFGFFETLGRSFVYSFKIAGSIFHVLGELLTGRIGISSLGGPVTTIATTSQIVSMGFRYFLEIAGFIGVNLAVFNLLPIPALDGSKIVFTLIEWVRGKPISRKVEAIIHAVGFVLLLGFAVLVDILQFVL